VWSDLLAEKISRAAAFRAVLFHYNFRKSYRNICLRRLQTNTKSDFLMSVRTLTQIYSLAARGGLRLARPEALLISRPLQATMQARWHCQSRTILYLY